MTDQEKLDKIKKIAENWSNPHSLWPSVMVDYGEVHREIGEYLLEILNT